ncbi:MAG: SyrP protein, partial [Pseudomonadota bacterium]
MVEGSGSLPNHLLAAGQHTDEQLATSGAILFRGFDVADPEDFDAAVQAYGAPGFTYAESLSNAVRVNVTERV